MLSAIRRAPSTSSPAPPVGSRWTVAPVVEGGAVLGPEPVFGGATDPTAGSVAAVAAASSSASTP